MGTVIADERFSWAVVVHAYSTRRGGFTVRAEVMVAKVLARKMVVGVWKYMMVIGREYGGIGWKDGRGRW
jgi:hypothetical protein